jgi:hypothetical protein
MLFLSSVKEKGCISARDVTTKYRRPGSRYLAAITLLGEAMKAAMLLNNNDSGKV